MTKNLLIVESPAKCKTIKKYLGPDYEVMASFGHISDLVKKNMGIDIENNFTPTYDISPEKKKVVADLRRAAKKAEKVWIATDEDREGEAIGWHVAQALKLDVAKTARITFHEITKPALQKAVSNPRTLDMNLVNAQQARRILDRLVGFELSPVLWKKIKGGLSAGRVQSVAVRIIVEREREIQGFEAKSKFKTVATFQTPDGETLSAECNKKFPTQEKAQEFLQSIINAEYTIESLQTKPGKKSASAPFTTSTLQQEASRKMGYAVSQTMRLAQKLYEAGHITYMRTDSLNISAEAKKAAESEIVQRYGANYSNPTSYKTKKSGAQEAHECIRPTNFNNTTAGATAQEKKVYQLIRKRTIASQMMPAQIEKTTAKVAISDHKELFVAKGEMITFDGFLKVYQEGKDEDNADEVANNKLLPALAEDMKLNQQGITSTQTFDRPPARYTEASLVKKLESEGIGRPSTYAPTIATVQKRGYVVGEDRPGVERKIQILQLSTDGEITSKEKTKITGAEKKKLFPTDTGMVVNDFLIEHFDRIMDYQFTAQVEAQFDTIAAGESEWTTILSNFYTPFHKTIVTVDETAERQHKEKILGKDPKTGKDLMVRMGRYGALIQIGNSEDEEKTYHSLPPGTNLETITLEKAIDATKMPRDLGEYKEKKVQSNIGRFGPYVKRGTLFVSIPKDSENEEDDPYIISAKRAHELIEAKIKADKEKIINQRTQDKQTITVEKGRRGAFIRVQTEKKKKSDNYKLTKEQKQEPEKLTLDDCLTIIKAG